MSDTTNTTLIGLLDNFDFSSADEISTSASVDAVINFLKRAEAHLASCLPLSPTTKPKSSFWDETSSPISALVDYKKDILDDSLVEDMKKELHTMKFVPMSGKSAPEVSLYGDIAYTFNGVTNLQLQPIQDDSVMSKVLDTINSKLGADYNSILVNNYKTKKVGLGWHKDDEREIDPSVPISTLSFGAARRFLITDSKDRDKRTQGYERVLLENSIFTMQPILQKTHFHKLAEGRENERGVRYSLTFRKLKKSPLLLDQVPALVSNVSTLGTASNSSAHSTTTADNHQCCVNTLVFGSSLTHGLDEVRLSARGKSFKVFTKGGARVNTVINMVKHAIDNHEICTSCVETIFLVVGGNDAKIVIQ